VSMKEEDYTAKIAVHITEAKSNTAKDLVNTGVDWVADMIVAMMFFIGCILVIGWIFG